MRIVPGGRVRRLSARMKGKFFIPTVARYRAGTHSEFPVNLLGLLNKMFRITFFSACQRNTGPNGAPQRHMVSAESRYLQ